MVGFFDSRVFCDHFLSNVCSPLPLKHDSWSRAINSVPGGCLQLKENREPLSKYWIAKEKDVSTLINC